MATIVSVLPPTTAILGVPIFQFTSPASVSAYTGGALQPSEILPEWIADAMQEVERQSGFCIQPREFTEVLDSDGSGSIFPHCFPIIEVQSVVISGHLIPPDHYAVYKDLGLIRLKHGVLQHWWLFPFMPFYYYNAYYDWEQRRGVQNIVVQGIAGYASIPPLVHKLVTLIAAKTALQSKFGPLVKQEYLGSFRQIRDFDKIDDELDRAWKSFGKRRPIFSV
ncbi:MAG: hypothetical protein ACYCPQ_00605 [Elusimicrobiota bacterium]